MKTIKALIGAVLICSTITTQAQITPPNYWQGLSSINGLPSNDVHDVLIEDLSNIWIATGYGLSHYDGSVFTNYSIANSSLNNNHIKELAFAQNKVWMITAVGLSSFDGTNFTNYTTSNGLLSNSITGLTVTTTDTLWIGSTSGVSKFDGSNFVHYNSIVAYDIETDSLDRVYTLMRRSIPVVSTVVNANIYSNGSWTTANASYPSYYLISDATLKKTKDGGLYLVSKGPKDYYSRISYPLTLNKIPINAIGFSTNPPLTSPVTDLTVFDAYKGKYWIGKTPNAIPILFSGRDSTFKPHFVSGGISRNTTSIDIKDSLLVLGTQLGIYITSTNIEPKKYHEDFNINQIQTSVNISDPIFTDNVNGGPNFEFPKNSGNHGIYAANFIVVGKKQNQNTFNAHPISPYLSPFSPGPYPYSSNVVGYNQTFLVKISKQEIDDHKNNFNQASYIVPQNIADWPATGDTSLGIPFDLAPFVDVDNDNCYNPANGDYPLIKGDLAMYWINHPNDQSLELEYHWMLYGYDRPQDTALNQSLFVQYTVINRSQDVYDSLKVGAFIDADLGNAGDDYIGCDSIHNIGYAYNGDLFDEGIRGQPGYGNNTPALGIKFLSDTMDNFMYFNIGNAANGDPQTAQHWKNYLEAKWKNGQKVRYGGDGFSSVGITNTATSHMFTGSPYTLSGWTELTPGGGASPHFVGDRRMIASIPYFSLQPNERKTIEVAYGFGRTTDTTSAVGQNINAMIQSLNHVENFWDTLSTPTYTLATTDSCISIPTSLSIVNKTKNSLNVFPIPTDNQLYIQSEENINSVEIYDFRGALVFSQLTNDKRVELNLGSFGKGLYVLRIENNGSWFSKKIILSE